MAHRLNFKDGKASMAYCGETPWHGLGTKVDGLQTAAAMLTAAGMDWTVSLRPVHVEHEPGKLAVIPGQRAIVRDDTGYVLGISTPRYTPVQNAQNGEMVDAIMASGACVETAGVLDNGERCWMLARIDAGTFEVTKGDAVTPYFALAWGHDARHGIAGKLTPIRIVCHNTLSATFGNSGAEWKRRAEIFLKHSKNASLRIAEAREALGLVLKQTDETAETYRALAGRILTPAERSDYVAGVFPYPAAAVDTESTSDTVARLLGTTSDRRAIADAAAAARERVDDVRDTINRLMGEGRGAQYAPGSAWNAYNAVTEYVDHVYPVLASGAVSEVRQQSALVGTYATVKASALAQAVSLLN